MHYYQLYSPRRFKVHNHCQRVPGQPKAYDIYCLDLTYCHFITHLTFKWRLAAREHAARADQHSSIGLTYMNSHFSDVFAVASKSPGDESASVSLWRYHLIWSDVAICTFLPHKCERQHATWCAGNMFSQTFEFCRLISAGEVGKRYCTEKICDMLKSSLCS